MAAQSDLPGRQPPSLAKADFETMALPHLDAVYRLAFRLTGDPTAAEDLTQDTFLKALKAFGSLRDPARVRSWLFQILSRLVTDRHRDNARDAGLDNVEIQQGMIEAIPLPDASVDAVISNGVLNLSTRKSRVLAEIIRVLRPGGQVTITDLVLSEALPEEVLKSPAALAG